MSRSLIVAMGMTLALTVPAAAAPARDAKVWAAAEGARPDQLKLLGEVVNIDSGTGDAAGGNRVQAVLAPRLKYSFSVTDVTVAPAGIDDRLNATRPRRSFGCAVSVM